MCSSLTRLKKKEVKYYTFFPLGNIIWGSHQPHFFVLIPMETVYVFFLDALYDLKTHKSNLEVSFSNKAILSNYFYIF